MSAAVSVDLVDANWRILQVPTEKPLTPRGRSRMSGNRRTRGHEELEKRNGTPKRSGRRFVALARATTGDLVDGLTEFFERDLEENDRRMVVGYSRNARRWERLRRKADAREIEARHKVILQGIENDLRMRAQRLYRQGDRPKLLERIAGLELELARVTSAKKREALQDRLAVAVLALVLLDIDFEVLAPYANVA